jgi:hypothetical protein
MNSDPMPQAEAQNGAKPAGAQNEGADPDGGGYHPPDFRGVRSKTHTYAVARDGRWILFDNVKDPYQQHNLIDDPAQKSLVDHFDKLIAVWLKDAEDPFDYQGALMKRSQAAA